MKISLEMYGCGSWNFLETGNSTATSSDWPWVVIWQEMEASEVARGPARARHALATPLHDRANLHRGMSTQLSSTHPLYILACENRLEEAIRFLVQVLDDRVRPGRKPVILHSLRVANMVLDIGGSDSAAVAGLLHDVLERTQITEAQLARRFGTKVAAMVAAVSNRPGISEPIKRYEESVRRCLAFGEDALVIRAMDLLDNCDRALALGLRARLPRLAEKLKLVIGAGRSIELDEQVMHLLSRSQRRLTRAIRLGG